MWQMPQAVLLLLNRTSTPSNPQHLVREKHDPLNLRDQDQLRQEALGSSSG